MVLRLVARASVLARSCLVSLRGPALGIFLVCYAAAVCVPGTAVAQSAGCTGTGAVICRGPITGAPNSYQVSDGYVTGDGASESSAISAYEARGESSAGYDACSVSYVDETPSWQLPGQGNGSAGSWPGYPNATPSYKISYYLSAETNQVINPLKFTWYEWNQCSTPTTEYAYVQRVDPQPACPTGYSPNNTGTPTDAYCWRSSTTIEPLKNLGPICPACSNAGGSSLSSSATSASKAGLLADPVNPGTGNAVLVETDYIGSGPMPLGFVRYYNTQLWTGGTSGTSAPTSSSFWSALGPNWRSSYDRFVSFDNAAVYPTADVYRPDGKTVYFVQTSGQFVPEADVADSLVELTNGSGALTGWQYTEAANDEVETYNASGQLLSLTSRSGLTQTLSYNSSGQLASVTDSFGHTLTFSYDSIGRLSTLTDPAGGVYSYTYTSVNDVSSDTYPDGAVRTYVYNESANLPNNYNEPYVMTGMIDETNTRFATFKYNSNMEVATSNLSGGVNQYSFTYSSNQTSVTDPLGTSRTLDFSPTIGVAKSTSVSSTCTTGCAGYSAATTYDTSGNVASRTDFNGNVTQYTNDLNRDLELSRTEAYGTSQARTITTTWSSSFRLPTQISVYAGGTATGTPLRSTAFTYDSNGNLLTKTLTDMTVTPNVSRTWTYTYDSYGRVLTAKGPRTDVNSTTTYAYYTCTTGSQCGELETVTDPVGNVTTYNTYNAHGQPLTITDPNGVVTTLTYDNRERLTSRQVGSETTGFSYYATGLLKQVTLPDSSYVLYTYDNAHRLIEISDGAGNSIQYTLDNMGNRTAEKTYDPSGNLHRTHTRVFNTLNELYQDVNAAGTSAVTTTYAYDNNANQTAIDAPLSRNTANAYDPLNRLTQITDPNSGVTAFSYDAEDDLTSVQDPRNLTTSYGYNGFGDVAQLSSPDTGSTANTYDSGGNLSTSTDARGAISSYAYDTANRVTSIAYTLGGTTDQTLSFGYDSGTYGKGRLTGASDANHSLAWTYDFAGRVVGKGLTVGSVNLSIGYAYTNGDLTALVTPSGQAVAYSFNSNHQVTGITVNGTVVLSGVTYEPFGGVNGWTWGDGTTSTRTFNGDGLVSQIVTAGVTLGYSFDNANRISGITDSSNSALSWTYGYDPLDRLTSATTSAITEGWTYDADGNQLTETGTTPITFTPSTSSNQLTATTGSLVRSYSYDAAGHILGYGTLGFSYNNRGRMESTSASSTDYLYNALGQMIEKSGTLGTTTFMQDEAGHLIGEYDGSGNLIEETIWLGDIPVATLQPNGSGGVNIFYIHTDHLNAPRKVQQPVTDALVWRWDTDPFGTAAPNQNPAGLGTFPYNIRFPGQYFMQETGLNYNWNRDYDPVVGRYIESDPLGLRAGVNTYAYSGSDPVWLDDPSGLLVRGSGWSNQEWKDIEDAEAKIRELLATSLCTKSGGCVPRNLAPTLLNRLDTMIVSYAPLNGDCSWTPPAAQIGGFYVSRVPWGRVPGKSCRPGCLASDIYHELLLTTGQVTDDSTGPGVNEPPAPVLERKCIGQLCKAGSP
jgi:RHS repeat-associated protein